MWFESAVYGSPLHEDDDRAPLREDDKDRSLFPMPTSTRHYCDLCHSVGLAARYERCNPTAVSENTIPLVTLAPSHRHSRSFPSSLSRSGSPCGSNPRENKSPLFTLAPSPCHSRPSPSSLARGGSPCVSN